MAPQFESGFLRDDFGIRARLGIPELPVPVGRDVNGKELVVEADVFIAWHKRTAPTLASRRHDLPMLYQVWLHRPQTTEKMGRAVYFEAGGEQYSVFASLAPTLFARKLPGGWLREKMLPAQKQSTGFAQTVIPRIEEQLPGTTLRPRGHRRQHPDLGRSGSRTCSWAAASSWRRGRSPRCSPASSASWPPPPRTPRPAAAHCICGISDLPRSREQARQPSPLPAAPGADRSL